MSRKPPLLVLASGSATRRALLEAAGVDIVVRPAEVDEAAIRDRMLAADANVSHESIAMTLAAEKAKAVTRRSSATARRPHGSRSGTPVRGRSLDRWPSFAAMRLLITILAIFNLFEAPVASAGLRSLRRPPCLFSVSPVAFSLPSSSSSTSFSPSSSSVAASCILASPSVSPS